jgi:hypothetical protein
MPGEERVRVEKVEVLSDAHYVLKRATFAYRRADGAWETQVRESYDRGNGGDHPPLRPRSADGGPDTAVPVSGLREPSTAARTAG